MSDQAQELRRLHDQIALLERQLADSRSAHDESRRELRLLQSESTLTLQGQVDRLKTRVRRILAPPGSLRSRTAKAIRLRWDRGHRLAGRKRKAYEHENEAQGGTGVIRISSGLAKRVKLRLLGGYSLDPRDGSDLAAPMPRDSRPLLVFADSQTFVLTAKAISTDRTQVPIAVWFRASEPRRPYELRQELRRSAFLAVSDDPAQVQRLELLGVPTVLAASLSDAVRLAASRAQRRKPSVNGSSLVSIPRTSELPILAGKPIPILFQVDHFLQGGLEQVVLDLGQGLARRGFEVSLLILEKQGQAAKAARDLGLEVLTLPAGSAATREDAYHRLLQERSIRLVKAQYSLFGAKIAHDLGIPFVQVIQNCYAWLPKRQAAQYRRADASTACTVCVSPEVACYSELNLGLSASKMAIIPNGADINRAEASGEQRRLAREEIGVAREDFLFLNVATVYPPKAQLVLAQAFAKVAAQRPQAKLALLGGEFDVNYATRVRDWIRRSGLEDRARMHGHRDDVAKFYSAADAFVLPSCWEGWSVALNEAIAAGLPVAATDVGSARDLLDPAIDVLIPPAYSSICEVNGKNFGRWVDIEWSRIEPDLIQAMLKLIDHPQRRPPQALSGFERTADRMCDDYARLFINLVRGNEPAMARAELRRPERSLVGIEARVGIS